MFSAVIEAAIGSKRFQSRDWWSCESNWWTSARPKWHIWSQFEWHCKCLTMEKLFLLKSALDYCKNNLVENVCYFMVIYRYFFDIICFLFFSAFFFQRENVLKCVIVKYSMVTNIIDTTFVEILFKFCYLFRFCRYMHPLRGGGGGGGVINGKDPNIDNFALSFQYQTAEDNSSYAQDDSPSERSYDSYPHVENRQPSPRTAYLKSMMRKKGSRAREFTEE